MVASKLDQYMCIRLGYIGFGILLEVLLYITSLLVPITAFGLVMSILGAMHVQDKTIGFFDINE